MSRTQKMLKDFLMEPDLQSKTRSTTMAALQTMVKVVKAIPKILSKQRSRETVERDEGDVKMASVTVKDIIGWRSFRDNVEVQGSDKTSSPEVFTATVSTTSCSSSSSKGSSWCDSDFTAEFSPPWCGKNAGSDPILQHNYKPGETYSPNYEEIRERSFSADMETEHEVKPNDSSSCSSYFVCFYEEQDQYDPEYKAVRLLKEVRALIPSNDDIDDNADLVLLDLFRMELREMRFRSVSCSDHDLLKTAMSWLKGDYDSSSYEWGVEKKRVGYKRDMDRGRWGESKEEVGDEIEGEVWSLLVQELATQT